ncbi:MMPL family transporter [Domibacillus indicus]|uniref:MMPL family transporter n=1 Tax=Domibacillus indicus TaxID=1437523 RepID=UPI00203B17CE|nr:MMPL family transporter [Domibacillus indicus]MCM3787319.1 MMPL family transporter [Domibacillus indicus]
MKKQSFAIQFWKPILILWLIAAAVFGFFAAKLPAKLEGDGFRTDGDYEVVQQELHDTFHFPEQTLLVLFEKRNHESSKAFQTNISSVLDEIDQTVSPSAIDSPLEKKEWLKEDIAYAAIHFDDPSKPMDPVIDDVRAILAKEDGISLTGGPVISKDINQASQDDLKRAELIGLPVALIVLLLALGTVVASILPLVIGGMTIIVGFGILSFIADSVDLAIFILNIAPMLGLALSIDFSLLFINRYKEERSRGRSVDEAIRITQAKAGHSILFSALCVFIGLGSVLLIDIDIFKNVAIGGMTVIAVAVIASMTLLPALLKLLGSRIYKGRILRVSGNSASRWRLFARFVMKHPVLVALLALFLLGTAVIPVKNMHLAIPAADSLPPTFESRTAYDKIEENFMKDTASTVYAVAERKNGWLDEDGLTVMKELEQKLKRSETMSGVETLFSISGQRDPAVLAASLENPQTAAKLEPAIEGFIQGDKLLLPISLNAEAASDEAQTVVRNWSEDDWPVKITFGGQPKFNQELYDEIFDKAAPVLAVILISTFFILMIAFRSVLIPLKAIIMNVLSLAATFGILVWLFQGGQLGMEPASVSLILPVLVFSLVFGLSMDYEVFLISRIREFYMDTYDNAYATVEGLASTSKIITSAAAIMIAITGAFAFTGVVPVKQIGIGIAIAIAIDATIVRLLLVPSLMKLLGAANWWMPFQKKSKKQSS